MSLVRCLAASSIVIVACGTSRPIHRPNGDDTSSLVGTYDCALAEADFAYDAFRCVIAQRGARLELAKQGGSQRIIGDLVEGERSFSFVGKMVYPYAGTEFELAGSFAQRPDGRSWIGMFANSSLTVLLRKRDDDGASYGGEGYAGATAPGLSFGAAFGVDPEQPPGQ